jgi:hypothetical protein
MNTLKNRNPCTPRTTARASRPLACSWLAAFKRSGSGIWIVQQRACTKIVSDKHYQARKTDASTSQTCCRCALQRGGRLHVQFHTRRPPAQKCTCCWLFSSRVCMRELSHCLPGDSPAEHMHVACALVTLPFCILPFCIFSSWRAYSARLQC